MSTTINELPGLLKDERFEQLCLWLQEIGYEDPSLQPASADASARRYFRFQTQEQSFIAVDTPLPTHENQAFQDIGLALRQASLRTPRVLHADMQRGFMVQDDFGTRTFAQAIEVVQEIPVLFESACEIITTLQNAPQLQQLNSDLPTYSHKMIQAELEIFRHWCLEKHLGLTLNDTDSSDWNSLCHLLGKAFCEQPTTFVHRDLHSRNIMMLADGKLGLIDFQGAVRGPLTYDWVSLIRDCYHTLPVDLVESNFNLLLDNSRQNGHQNHSASAVRRWFDYTGMQRHLKAVGIFCRLKHRDRKEIYMEDIPRTFQYIHRVANAHKELSPLRQLIENHNLMEKLC